MTSPQNTETPSNSPAALLERTREQLRTWSSARRDELQETAATITEKRQELLKQGEELLASGKEAVLDRKAEILRQREEATRLGRDTLLGLEAQALEGARDLLARAEELVGPGASFLSRGREALDDAIISVRSGFEGGLPIEDFDTLSIAKLRPFLDDLSPAELRTIRAYEGANKKRVTLLRELDARLPEAPAAS